MQTTLVFHCNQSKKCISSACAIDLRNWLLVTTHYVLGIRRSIITWSSNRSFVSHMNNTFFSNRVHHNLHTIPEVSLRKQNRTPDSLGAGLRYWAAFSYSVRYSCWILQQTLSRRPTKVVSEFNVKQYPKFHHQFDSKLLRMWNHLSLALATPITSFPSSLWIDSVPNLLCHAASSIFPINRILKQFFGSILSAIVLPRMILIKTGSW